MKTIPLSKGLFATVDDEDFESLGLVKWSAQIKDNERAYAIRGTGESRIVMHRYILGISDKSIHVDHRDGNGLNNCRSNLRTCTPAQNVMNRRKLRSTSSKYKGVTVRGKRYESAIQFKGKNIYLGTFTHEYEAAEIYNRKAIELFGEFASINLIQQTP
jgi:hypothetical protein